MRPAVRWAVVGLIALAAGVHAGRAAQSVPERPEPARSAQLAPIGKTAEARAAAFTEKNADLVRFSFGDTHFAIPRRYLGGAPQFPGGNEPAFFRLFLTLPDLQPATSQELRQPGWGRTLLAWVSYKSPERGGKELLSIILHNGGKAKPIQTAYGATLYELSQVPYYNKDLYVWKNQDFLFFLLCDRKSPFKNPAITYYPSCRVAEKLWDNIAIDYAFGKSFLPDAVSIDQRLRNLLSSFRASADQSHQR